MSRLARTARRYQLAALACGFGALGFGITAFFAELYFLAAINGILIVINILTYRMNGEIIRFERQTWKI